MNASRVHQMLEEACRELEHAGEHAAAAFVGHAMNLIQGRYPGLRPSHHARRQG